MSFNKSEGRNDSSMLKIFRHTHFGPRFLPLILSCATNFQVCIWSRKTASFRTVSSHLLCGLPTDLFLLKLPPKFFLGLKKSSVRNNVTIPLESLYPLSCEWVGPIIFWRTFFKGIDFVHSLFRKSPHFFTILQMRVLHNVTQTLPTDVMTSH